jgi:hypothetical protein
VPFAIKVDLHVVDKVHLLVWRETLASWFLGEVWALVVLIKLLRQLKLVREGQKIDFEKWKTLSELFTYHLRKMAFL